MRYTLLIFVFFVFKGFSQTSLYELNAIHHPVLAHNGMVATQHYLASEVGVEILKRGGNAVDAAVAVGFALAVVLPRAGNLGGGGFMLVHLAEQKRTIAINYRETAPEQSSKDMYLGSNEEVDQTALLDSYLSVGVPGTVAGLLYALEKYGTMSVKEVLKPAIQLAKNGFIITPNLAQALANYQDRLSLIEATKSIFYKGEECYDFGERLVQKDLAWTLKQIAKKGRDGFYDGKVAQLIAEDALSNGGILTKQDLKNYKVEELEPVTGLFNGYQIISMPPPSSGGIHLIQMLNMLEELELGTVLYNSADYYHLLVETMKLAYADRSKFIGDPNFWETPMKGLTAKAYAKVLGNTITDTARSSTTILPGNPFNFESEETTHFSVIDKDGNAVSNTYTLNFSFGSGIVARGTGVLLNNEMADFSAKSGTADAYGLISGEANGVIPGKRPLSSMTPVMVFENGEMKLITGSPGGSRIITSVLQVILNVCLHHMNIAEATHQLRIHHQWHPDLIYYDGFLSPDTQSKLILKGHKLKQRPSMGSTQSIGIGDNYIMGASDPRRPDARSIGY